MSARKRPREDDSLLSVFYDDSFQRSKRMVKALSPQMNKYEHTDKETGVTTVTVTFGLPGLQAKDVVVDLLHDELTISGQSVDDHLPGKHIVGELSYGKFARVVAVPLGMRPQDLKAKMEHGLLVVTFPKDPPEQKPQRILIESAHAPDMKVAN